METMNRRSLLAQIGRAGALGFAASQNARPQSDLPSQRGGASPKIANVEVIECEPSGVRLSVVKITTDQDGLHGYGCATFTQRADLVKPAVEKYLKPFLQGKATDRIEDIWQSCYSSSYWRNGPVLNNAISGVDQALWDIKGRMAGMPVYQLAGGKCREAADCYSHADGKEIPEVIDSAQQILARGFRHVRVQIGVPGMAAYGSRTGQSAIAALHDGPLFEPAAYMRRTLRMMEAVRAKLGDEVELLHDVHERVSPHQAVQFAKELEPFRLFYMEDALAPEDIDYFRQIRAQSTTPLAMGELFNNPHEWTPLIAERLIDYIRCHVSQVGGFTPARKIAILAEAFGVKTAWHGPGDVSPIGHAANVTLDLVSPNFGIQEYSKFDGPTQEIFSNCPVMKAGYLYANDAPGWGIEVDLKAAAKYPFGTKESPDRSRLNGGWGEVRRSDGTIIRQ